MSCEGTCNNPAEAINEHLKDKDAAIQQTAEAVKSLVAEGVTGCIKTVDPLSLIAQLALTIVELQKDMKSLESNIATQLGAICKHIDEQFRKIDTYLAESKPKEDQN